MARKRVSQTSLEYWKKREDEARKLYQEQEKNYDEEISRIYNRMLQDVQLQINGFFGRYAKSEGISIAEAKARASAMDVASFAEKAKKYVQARDFSKEANEVLKLYNLTMKVNRLELLKANIGLEMVSGFDEMNKYFEQIMIDRVNDECERQSGIQGQTIKSNAKMAKSLVGASFNNATFSDRIWMYQGMLKSELSSLLEQGLIQGKHANVLARDLEKRFGVNKFYCQRLMRTEMARVQTEAQKESLEQTGYDEYIFIAEHDARTCRVCGWLDGRTYKLSEMMPGTNAAPIHPMCRCSIAAYMERGQFERMVAMSQTSIKGEKELAYVSDDGKTEPGHVNIELVNTAKYHMKYNKLTHHKKTNESLYNEAMRILDARNNTELEEIVALDARDGTVLEKNTYKADQGIKHACSFDDLQAKTLEYRGTQYEVLHNHPNSSVPSRDDIKMLFLRKNQVGSTIVCHNGDLYRIEKLKQHKDIELLIDIVYSDCKSIFSGFSNEKIEYETTMKLIKRLVKTGHINFENR